MCIFSMIFALFWQPFCLIFLTFFWLDFWSSCAAPARLLRGSLGGIWGAVLGNFEMNFMYCLASSFRKRFLLILGWIWNENVTQINKFWTKKALRKGKCDLRFWAHLCSKITAFQVLGNAKTRKTQVRGRIWIRSRNLPIVDCKMFIFNIMFALFLQPFGAIVLTCFPTQFLKTRAAPARLPRGSCAAPWGTFGELF